MVGRWLLGLLQTGLAAADLDVVDSDPQAAALAKWAARVKWEAGHRGHGKQATALCNAGKGCWVWMPIVFWSCHDSSGRATMANQFLESFSTRSPPSAECP